MGKIDRGKLDDTLAAMFSNVTYRSDYLFYAHLVGQCSIKIDYTLEAPAGVAFVVDHYNLYINPKDTWIPWDAVKDNIIDKSVLTPDYFKTEKGVKMFRYRRGYDSYNLVERLAILKHEMLHIALGHVGREGTLKHKRWNWATDCAINQMVNKDHLPTEGITPEVIFKRFGIKVPYNRSSEEYYNLLDMIKEDPKGGDGESGQDGTSDEKGAPVQGDDPGMGTHDTWEESNGDPELQQDVTKKMLDKSQEETIKGKGTIPSECGDWLTMHTRKSEVSWKKVLRGIVGNKKVGSRPTIMKSDRRFPNRPDLRGKVKDRMFNLLIIADVSGSMSDQMILDTFGEVRHICDVTKTAVDLIQIDTQAYSPEKLTKQTKLVKRKGCGGTTLFPAIELAKKHRIDYQAVVVLTDGGLFGNDVSNFASLKKRVIWLIPKDGQILDEMNTKRMTAFKLKV